MPHALANPPPFPVDACASDGDYQRALRLLFDALVLEIVASITDDCANDVQTEEGPREPSETAVGLCRNVSRLIARSALGERPTEADLLEGALDALLPEVEARRCARGAAAAFFAAAGAPSSVLPTSAPGSAAAAAEFGPALVLACRVREVDSMEAAAGDGAIAADAAEFRRDVLDLLGCRLFGMGRGGAAYRRRLRRPLPRRSVSVPRFWRR